MTFRDILRRHVLILGIALAACTISSSAHAQSLVRGTAADKVVQVAGARRRFLGTGVQ